MTPVVPPTAPRRGEAIRRVLLVGMQRSGTTVTQSLLAGLPTVAVAREEIHTALFQRTVAANTDRGESAAQRSASLRRVVDELAGRRPRHEIVAVKTALPDVRSTARFVACVNAHADDFALVVVRRRDLLAQLASLRRAQATGVWHRQQGDDRVDTRLRLTITEAELADYVQTCVDCERLLQQLQPGRRMLQIDYETHVVGNLVADELARFLGVPVPPRPPRLRKASPPASHYVVGYDRLAAMLPHLLAQARSRPPRAPEATDVESRVFLLHRARMRLRDGAREAAEDALAAIAAPPDWGTPSQQWAADTLGDALLVANDRELARRVADRVAGNDDPHLVQLLARLQAALDPR